MAPLKLMTRRAYGRQSKAASFVSVSPQPPGMRPQPLAVTLPVRSVPALHLTARPSEKSASPTKSWGRTGLHLPAFLNDFPATPAPEKAAVASLAVNATVV
jgi:hypothetical protein